MNKVNSNNKSQRSRILLYSPQLLKTGGIESHLKKFCELLANENVEITLLVLNSQISEQSRESYLKNCKQVILISKGRSIFRFLFLLYYGIKINTSRFDALYTNGQGNSIALLGRIFSRIPNWVHHHHTSGDSTDRRSWSKSYKDALVKAKHVVACSAQNAAEMGADLQRKIISVPCFSNSFSIGAASRDLTNINIAYFGRLIPEKGIEVICNLSNEPAFSNVNFHIWGKGVDFPPSYFEAFPKLNYHGGFETKDELQRVLESIQAFMLISRHPEGLPVSLLECMSAGLPWIATDSGGIRDIVVDPRFNYLIPANSSYEQIKKSLSSFINNIKDGYANRSKQIEYYQMNYSSDIVLKQWMTTLFSV